MAQAALRPPLEALQPRPADARGHEARADEAAARELLQLDIADLGMDGGDAARRHAVGAALVERVARHRVVEAVAARVDLHAAADAERLRPGEVVLERIGQRMERWSRG